MAHEATKAVRHDNYVQCGNGHSGSLNVLLSRSVCGGGGGGATVMDSVLVRNV